MPINFNLRSGGCQSQSQCLDKFGCPPNTCPDFVIRRHDTKPPLKIAVEDCDGAMDFRGLVVEVNMWALAKLRDVLDEDTDNFRLADNIGFEQIMVGDVIIVDQIRMPERMLVLGFDEHNKYIKVERGYQGTTKGHYSKATKLRIFRILNGHAETEMVFEDVQTIEGRTDRDVLQESYLIYEWQPEDTCLPGCYWLEFKVLKMIDMVWYLPGGNWVGETNTDDDGYFYTGSALTESSVRLSFDQVSDLYLIPHVVWTGDTHLHTDDKYYTGSVHNDGSVLLNETGVPSDTSVEYNEDGVMSFHDISVIPSFTDENLTPADFGCILGAGVEWVRRFPMGDTEGFLIQITNSPTTEI